MCVESIVARFGHLQGGGRACFQGQNSKVCEFDVWSINDWWSNLSTSLVEVFLSEARCA